MLGATRLRNSIQHYAWGSRTFIPSLMGREPGTEPEAELWMGAHPKAPSSVQIGDRWVPLNEVILTNPIGFLGESTVREFGNKLPFLFKVLAASGPLSIQAHPDLSQAQEGFRRENTAGVPFDAFERNYRDDNHKPEVISALTPVWALKGFRAAGEIEECAKAAGLSTLGSLLQPESVWSAAPDLKGFFQTLVAMPDGDRRRAVDGAVDHARSIVGHVDESELLAGTDLQGDLERARWQWVLVLQKRFPYDPGVLAPLYLNLVRLSPGDSLFLEAGELHAYLCGAGIELMANSDNVLRGGLTQKHIDVSELNKVVRFVPHEVKVVGPVRGAPGETRYPTGVSEFLLSVIATDEDLVYHSEVKRSIEILICTEGAGLLTERRDRTVHSLRRGDSCVVPAAVDGYSIEGTCRVYKATVPGGNPS